MWKKKDEDTIRKCEVTFYCLHSKCREKKHTITVRHYSVKNIQCKWCGTWYTFTADGTRFKKLEHYLNSGIVPEPFPRDQILSIGVDETILEDNDSSWKDEIRIGDKVQVYPLHQPRSFIGKIKSFTDHNSAMVEELTTLRSFDIPLTDIDKEIT